MKLLWCWRCRAEVPMLDDAEFAALWVVLHDCTRAAKRRAEEVGHADHASVAAEFDPVRRLYRELTGVEEHDVSVIQHHGLGIYGPPCTTCGKPLRSP